MVGRFPLVLALGASLLTLGGCGHSATTRALSGGAIGAGAGALLGVAGGFNPAVGALVGGGAGAITGALTAHH